MKNIILIVCIFMLLSGCFYKPEIVGENNDGSSFLDTLPSDVEEPDKDANSQDVGNQSDIIDISNKCKDNDNFYCSTEVKLGGPINDRILYNGEENYYKIVLPSDGVLIIDIQPVPSNIDIFARLYDSVQNRIWERHNWGKKGKAFITETLLKKGTYYLEISDCGNDASSAEFYTMKITLDTEDKYEFNNTFSDAKSIKLDEEISVKIRPYGDYDYFKFNLESDGVLVIDIQPVPSNIDIFARLYDSVQNRIWERHNWGKQGKAFITETLLKKGTYYLEISDCGDDASSADFYKMKLYYKE